MKDNDSIYSPPSADLTIKQELSEEYLTGPLTRQKLNIIAWLSLFYFVLTFPTIAVSYLSEFYGGSGVLGALNMGLTVINSLIYIYLMLMFRLFLNLRFNYSGVNIHIIILIVLALALNVTSLLLDDDFGFVAIAFLLSLVPFGIVNILFGKRLLSIKEDFSYLRLYSWSTIFTGIFLATVILLMLAVPAALVASFAFMMIFFTALKEMKAETAP
jgi:hypothetical protein